MQIDLVIQVAQVHHLSLAGFELRDVSRGLSEADGEVVFYRANTIASRTVTDLRSNLRPVMRRRLFIIVDCSMLNRPNDFDRSETADDYRRAFEYAQAMFRNIIDDCHDRNASLILLNVPDVNRPLGNRLIHINAEMRLARINPEMEPA